MYRHYVYSITIEGTPIYVGYTERSPSERLAEHLASAFGKNKTKTQILNDAARGQDTLKNRLIKQAVEEGLVVDIVILEEADGWIPLDEQAWIDEIGYDFKLVNSMSGAVWQPYALIDGKPVRTAKINPTELRNDIQDWRKNKRKPAKTNAKSVSHKSTPGVTSLSNEEFVKMMKLIHKQTDIDFDSFCKIRKSAYIKEHGVTFYDDPDYRPIDTFNGDKRVPDEVRDKIFNKQSFAL